MHHRCTFMARYIGPELIWGYMEMCCNICQNIWQYMAQYMAQYGTTYGTIYATIYATIWHNTWHNIWHNIWNLNIYGAACSSSQVSSHGASLFNPYYLPSLFIHFIGCLSIFFSTVLILNHPFPSVFINKEFCLPILSLPVYSSHLLSLSTQISL